MVNKRVLLISAVWAAVSGGAAYAAPPDIQPPQLPAGATSGSASVVSGDGTVIAGAATIGGVTNIYTWSLGAASVARGRLGTFTFNGVSAASYDGAVLTGTSSSSGTPGHAYRWTAATGFVDLGNPAPSGGLTFGGLSALGISYDGNTIVGQTSLNSTRPFIWRAGSGFQVLDALPSGFTSGGAQKVSGDGAAVVGLLFGATTAAQRGFVWKNGTFTVIPVLPIAGLTRSSARAVNRDGSVVAGDSQDNSGAGAQIAFRWTAATGPQSLGTLANTDWSLSSAISGDGSRVVGQTGNNAGSLTYGFLWTTSDGMRSLDGVMAGLGIGAGWHLTSALSISDDGQIIVGSGRDPANQSSSYVLRLAAGAVQTTSTSTSRTVTVTPVSVTNAVQTYRTSATGALDGKQVFSEQIDQPIANSDTQAMLARAQGAIQTAAGLRRVTYSAPALVSSQNVLVSSSGATSDVISDSAPQLIGDFVVSGPATIRIGDLGVCSFGGAPAQGATPAAGPSGCSGGVDTTLAANQQNTNTHYNIQRTITRTTTTNETRRLEQAYAVSAAAGYQVGGVHRAVRPAVYDTGEWFMSGLMGQRGGTWAAGEGRGRAWFEAYQADDAADGDGAVVAETKQSEQGAQGALGYRVAPGVVVGAGAAYGRSNIDVAAGDFPEAGRVRLTQAGAFAEGQWGGWRLAAAATTGRGAAHTDVAGANIARYSLRVNGVSAQVGYEVSAGDWSLTPEVGASSVRAENDRFAESGSLLSLAVDDQAATRRRVWVAASLAGAMAVRGIVLHPELRASLADVDDGGPLLASFLATPSSVSPLAGGDVGHSETGIVAGLSAQLSPASVLRFSYNGRFRDGYRSNGAGLALRIVW